MNFDTVSSGLVSFFIAIDGLHCTLKVPKTSLGKFRELLLSKLLRAKHEENKSNLDITNYWI